MRSSRLLLAAFIAAALGASPGWALAAGSHGAGASGSQGGGGGGHGYYGGGYHGGYYYGGGYRGGYYSGGRYGYGVYFGGPWWGWPGYYAPYYYPPYYGYPYYNDPLYSVTDPPPPTYPQDVQPAPQTSPAPGYWYYCRDPQGYYPYVGTCKGAWEPVPARPPAQR